MPMVLPIVAAFSAAAAATTTVGIFLTYTATALTVMGALSGNKDLTKFGSLLTLGAGLVGMASSAGAAAGEVGADAATSEAWSSGAGLGQDKLGAVGGNLEDGFTSMPANAGLDQAIEQASNAGVSASEVIDPMQRANEAMGATAEAAAPPSSVFERASNSASSTVGEQAGSIMERGAQASPAGMPSGGTINGQVVGTGANDPLTQFAGSNTSSQISNLGQRGGAGAPSTNPLSQIGNWVKNNKELSQLGGQLVGGLANGYGQAQQLGYEQSIMERRLRNINNPVALTFGKV